MKPSWMIFFFFLSKQVASMSSYFPQWKLSLPLPQGDHKRWENWKTAYVLKMYWKNGKMICFSYYYAGRTGISKIINVYFLILVFNPILDKSIYLLLVNKPFLDLIQSRYAVVWDARFHHQGHLDFVKHLINVYLLKFILIVNGWLLISYDRI